jgi:hypothetical protein
VKKIWYAVVMSSRKLHHYFEAHTIKVLTNQPLKTYSATETAPAESASGRLNYQSMW